MVHRLFAVESAVGLSEVLAGPETHLPEPGLLFLSPVRRERSTTLQPSESRARMPRSPAWYSVAFK